MVNRVTEAEVREIIDTNSSLSVAPFISAANALTDKVSSNDTNGVLNTALLKEIEKYLAAFFYALRDPQYTNKSTSGAGGGFQTGSPGKRFELNDWGRAALALDVSGYLNSLNTGIVQAGAYWLGLVPREQKSWSQVVSDSQRSD